MIQELETVSSDTQILPNWQDGHLYQISNFWVRTGREQNGREQEERKWDKKASEVMGGNRSGGKDGKEGEGQREGRCGNGDCPTVISKS